MSICLNMIVKDEEKIIERCLRSVIPFIHFFVIMDTGSKDDTMNIIKKVFSEKNIKGILYKGQFKNFGQARNLALSVAYEKSGSDYILLLDADHILKVSTCLSPKVDSYYITQLDGKIEYKNIRLIKNNRNYYYKGYTHEVLLSFKKDIKITLSKEDVYIDDIGDGGSKSDKNKRDIHLLVQEIKECPTYSRPYFYLANTYFGEKDFILAEKYYRRRISMGGWKEELWYSYYRMASIRIIQKNIPEAIYFLMSAIETNYQRLEAYFHLLIIFRDLRMDNNFKIYHTRSKDIYDLKLPSQDFLFYEKEIYEKKFKDLFLV
jgi:tetratricopeptide (TPR) repeat protein